MAVVCPVVVLKWQSLKQSTAYHCNGLQRPAVGVGSSHECVLGEAYDARACRKAEAWAAPGCLLCCMFEVGL